MNPAESDTNQMPPSNLPASERLAMAASGLVSAVKTQTVGEKGEQRTMPGPAPEQLRLAWKGGQPWRRSRQSKAQPSVLTRTTHCGAALIKSNTTY